MILLSDGVDSHSALGMVDVRRVARSSQAIIYWIRMADEGMAGELPNLSSTWRDVKSHQHEFQQLVETVRLGHGPRETVEQKTARPGVVLVQAGGNHGQHDLVGNEVARVEIAARLETECGPGFHRRPQHVAG